METRKNKGQILTDERLLKMMKLNYSELCLLKKMTEHSQCNRLGCLEGKSIWDLDLPLLPLFPNESKEVYKQSIQKLLKNLTQQQLVVFDLQTDLIYLTTYFIEFPLKNNKEAREVECLFTKIPSTAKFYPLLIFDLLQMDHLKGNFRYKLKYYLSSFLQQGGALC